MPEERGTKSLVPATKKIGENATSFLRSKLAVVEPHSRSISPDFTAGMRVSAVTFLYLTAISTPSSSFETSSTTALHRSIE